MGQAVATPSFHNWVPSLSSLLITPASSTSPKNKECKKEEIPKEFIKKEKSYESLMIDTPKMEMLELSSKQLSPVNLSSPSKVNVCLCDD